MSLRRGSGRKINHPPTPSTETITIWRTARKRTALCVICTRRLTGRVRGEEVVWRHDPVNSAYIDLSH